jgi:hypothetical protein
MMRESMGESLHESIADTQENRSARYWEQRKDAIYLFAAKLICNKYGGDPASVVDVGSNGTPTLEWHRDTAVELVSVDLREPYRAAGVLSLKCDFLKYQPPAPFDLATCFQVLEHVRNPAAFARRLLAIARVVIVSVPYKWRKGLCKYHLQDPVDEAKMFDWFEQEPTFSYVARELNRRARLINVYAPAGDPL